MEDRKLEDAATHGQSHISPVGVTAGSLRLTMIPLHTIYIMSFHWIPQCPRVAKKSRAAESKSRRARHGHAPFGEIPPQKVVVRRRGSERVLRRGKEGHRSPH